MNKKEAIRELQEALRAANVPNCGDTGYVKDDTGKVVEANYPFKVGYMESAIRSALRALDAPEQDSYDPAPYCSYGHRTKSSCDCGPIASNE